MPKTLTAAEAARAVVACGVVVLLAACNRAAVRIPLASLPFPDTPTGFRASSELSVGITVLPIVDTRPSHYGERVGGTRWTACETDSFIGNEAAEVVGSRLETALIKSGLFQTVSTEADRPERLVLRTQMDAFCAQAWGFLFIRVAGISAFRFQVNEGERILFDEKIEQVVTDADDAYTGWAAATIEQAMRRALADSLRLVLTRFLAQAEAALSPVISPAASPP